MSPTTCGCGICGSQRSCFAQPGGQILITLLDLIGDPHADNGKRTTCLAAVEGEVLRDGRITPDQIEYELGSVCTSPSKNIGIGPKEAICWRYVEFLDHSTYH